MSLLTSDYGGEISRTATGDAPLPRIGCPVALVPQPAMLIIVAGIWLAPAGGSSGIANEWGFRNTCRNPITVTGFVGWLGGGLLITGIVTRNR